MKLSAFKELLKTQDELQIELENGTKVPAHFHITEVGMTTKNFIDCGGTIREDKKVNFQIWTTMDFYHRLKAEKLLRIIESSKPLYQDDELEIEVEYQGDTIGKYGLEFKNEKYILTNQHTNCLANDVCGVTPEKIKIKLGELKEKASSCCTPGGGCC